MSAVQTRPAPRSLVVMPLAQGEERAWASLPGAAEATGDMRVIVRDGTEVVGGAVIAATDVGASLETILVRPGREAQVVQALVGWVVRSCRGTVTATSWARGKSDVDPLLFPLCAQGLRLTSTTAHVGRSLAGVAPGPTCVELVSRGQLGRAAFAQIFEATTLGTEEKRFRGRPAAAILAELEALVGPAGADQSFFVARMAGQPVGVVLLRRDPRVATLGECLWVGVVPAMRRRGLGAELFGLGLVCLAVSGITEYLGACDHTNRPLRRIFERNECQPLAQERQYAMVR